MAVLSVQPRIAVKKVVVATDFSPASTVACSMRSPLRDAADRRFIRLTMSTGVSRQAMSVGLVDGNKRIRDADMRTGKAQTRPSPANGDPSRCRIGRQIESSQHPDHGRASASSHPRIQLAQNRRTAQRRRAQTTDVICAPQEPDQATRRSGATSARAFRSQRDRLLLPACDAEICAAPSGQARLIPSRAQLWPTRTPSPPASPAGRSRDTPS